MINRKVLFAASAMTLAMLSFGVRADDAPTKTPSATMKCMAGKEMQCTMAMHMADMQKQMAKMHDAMAQCTKDGAPCDKSTMMNDMQNMHSRMGEMMKSMMAMPDDQKMPSGSMPNQSDDHAEHHKDASPAK